MNYNREWEKIEKDFGFLTKEIAVALLLLIMAVIAFM